MHQGFTIACWVEPFFCGTLAPNRLGIRFLLQFPEACAVNDLNMALGFGFNKAKVLASAEKFVQQGKLPNAIAEYEKITKEDPKDLTVLNTIGDLYARLNQNEHAAMYFRKVGDQYAQNGFTVKAIAIYKKLSKLSPNNNEIITKLAELYTQQGLFNDARVQYMQIADGYLRSGDHTQAARIMQRILELDPENTATQARLAELYVKLGKREDARNIYYNAAQSLYARGLFDAAGEALNKVITLDPGNADALLLRGMIAADSGDHLNAARYLEQVPNLESKPEGLSALLRAEMQSGNIENAEKAATKLLILHKDSGGITSLADWCLSHNRVNDAVRLVERNSERLFAGGPAAAQEFLRPLLDRVKDNPEALSSLNRLLEHSGDTSRSAEVMEMQAHAFAQKGQYAQARDLYKKLSQVEPENSLHAQNYKQMLAKLGEDSASRILSPEEAAQAFMVEELDEGNAPVQQKYDPPTETAIESALTDAELFVSYNVPSKAIPPLEAALPLAPHDVALNQRLATLYTRAERWADAARVCRTLAQVYQELGHEKESARYAEAAKRYSLRAGSGSGTASTAAAAELPTRSASGLMDPAAVQPQAAVHPLLQATPAPPPPAAEMPIVAEPSIKEFSFDMPDQIVVEHEVEVIHEGPAPVELELSAAPQQGVEVEPVALAPQAEEIDLSSEWESMTSVEMVEEAAPPPPPVAPPRSRPAMRDPFAQSAPVHGMKTPAPEPEIVEEPEGGSGVCYRNDEKVQEIQFYISQQMWPAAKKAIDELSEMSPDAPEIPELIAAVAAGQSRPSATTHASEAFAGTALGSAANVDFLPPPFAAPAPPMPVMQPEPELVVEPEPVQFEAEPAAFGEAPADSAVTEHIFEVEQETTRRIPKAVAEAATQPTFAEPAHSTEDILTDFIHDLETTDLADFAPKPKAEPAHAGAPAAATKPEPVPASSIAAKAEPKPAYSNGGMKDAEAASVLNDILADLQDETAEPTESEEDPETHYNLGIAFKEMGLLDEAIGELQKVCRAIDQGHKFSQPIQAYTWLAQCLVDKGAPEAAVRWYQKALQLSGLDDSSRNAIYYDLGSAYEASGDKKSALANFMEVYGSNIDFRDVASRIKTLKS